MAEYLRPLWSGVARVCRITRERIARGKKTIETVYAITSLDAARAGPEQLLALSRAHWGIENCLHYVRDVSCREDQARAHAGHAPEALAACRNTALTAIRRLGFKVVEGFEHFAEHRLAAIEAVGADIDDGCALPYIIAGDHCRSSHGRYQNIGFPAHRR